MVIWHDIECGGYRADLSLWRELADGACRPPGSAWISEIGAGSGRVSLEIARRGHRVLALDRDPRLLEALRERANGSRVTTVCADARSFALDDGASAACLVPMQTIQLLGGAAERAAFLRRARAHLREGGLLACAIVERVDPFVIDGSREPPAAESAVVDGRLHVSRPTALRCDRRTITIERERVIHTGAGRGTAAASRALDVTVLQRLTARELHAEAAAAGFRPAGVRELPSTEDHHGGKVVLARA